MRLRNSGRIARRVLAALGIVLSGIACAANEAPTWIPMEDGTIAIEFTDINGVTVRLNDHPSAILPSRIAATDNGLRFEPTDLTRGLDMSFSTPDDIYLRLQLRDVRIYGWWPLRAQCAADARVRVDAVEYCRVQLAFSNLIVAGVLDKWSTYHQPFYGVDAAGFASSLSAGVENWSEPMEVFRAPPGYVEIAAGGQVDGVVNICEVDGDDNVVTIALVRLADGRVSCNADFVVRA